MSLFDLGNNALRNNELQRKIEEEALFEQAINSVRTGNAPAGGNIDVPLKISQKITVVALNSDDKYYYTTYDFTKNVLSKTVNSGLHTDDWEFDEIIPDAMGYSFVVYSSSNSNMRKVHYVGPDAKIVDGFEFDFAVFNHYNYITYYNGGIGLFMYSGSGDARFYYAYNGQIYQKSWDGNFYGMQYDGSDSATINGVANFYLSLDAVYGAEHWRIIPGEGFVLIDQYYDINISQHEVSPYLLPDGKPSFNGYFADYNVTLATFNNPGEYLQSFFIWKDKSEPYLDVYDLIQTKLLDKYGVDDFSQIYLDNWLWCRGGDALCLTLHDNAAEEDYTLVVNVRTKTIDFVIDRALGPLIITPHPTALVWFTYDYNNNIGGFVSSDIAFKIDILYPDNTHEQFTIPRLSGGNEVYVTYDSTISKNGNHFTLLTFVDDGDRQLKIARSSKGKGITYTNILNWKASVDFVSYNICYSDLKNEWFWQLQNYLDSPERIEMISISRDGAILGPPSSINLQDNTQYYTYGGFFVPALVHAYFPAGVNKVWRLNYSNYKWEEVISITAVPTGDSYINFQTQFYYGGYMFEGGSSYLVFVDPDAFVSYYFSTKYGVVKTNNVPLWSVAPTGDQVGQSYTTVAGEYDIFAISTSTGKRVSRSYLTDDDQYFGEAVSDVFVYGHGPGEPSNNKIDLIAGWKKKTINWDYVVWWRHHDMVRYN